MDAVGPVARSAADIAPLFDAIAGRGAPSAVTERAGLRIGIPDRFFFDRVEPDIGDLIETARNDFLRLGTSCISAEVPDPTPLFAHALVLAQAEAAAIHRRLIAGRRADYDHGTVEGIEPGFAIAAHEYAESLAAREPARRAWVDGVFTRCDLLLTPVFEHATPRLDDCDPARPGAMREFLARFGRCTRPFSYLGLPALALPCGFQPDGMPAALQLVARPGAEAVLLAAGEAYQRETGWHRRAPPAA
jgi:aspartyl-tRNA(Asn)/glutamyl-tRNA(Gln) amidotransferase subunit A